MKQKDIDNHPLLTGFTRDEKDEVWHSFRAKYPNRSWGLSFFAMWLFWALSFMILAQFLDSFIDGFGVRLMMHLIVSLGIGVIGGVIVIGSFMLPKRRREYFNYLRDKTVENVLEDLDLSHLNSNQTVQETGTVASDE